MEDITDADYTPAKRVLQHFDFNIIHIRNLES